MYFIRICEISGSTKKADIRNCSNIQTVNCVQVALEFGEYRVDKQSRTFLVIGENKLYNHELFEILPDGSASMQSIVIKGLLAGSLFFIIKNLI